MFFEYNLGKCDLSDREILLKEIGYIWWYGQGRFGPSFPLYGFIALNNLIESHQP